MDAPFLGTLDLQQAGVDPDLVEAIALRVAELMRSPAQDAGWCDAAQLAERYQLSVDWVYEHKDELGGIPLGSGSRPRLRFSVAAADAAMAKRAQDRLEAKQPKHRKRSHKRKPAATASLPPARKLIVSV